MYISMNNKHVRKVFVVSPVVLVFLGRWTELRGRVTERRLMVKQDSKYYVISVHRDSQHCDLQVKSGELYHQRPSYHQQHMVIVHLHDVIVYDACLSYDNQYYILHFRVPPASHESFRDIRY